MVTPHSPLPPPMVVSLDTIALKLDHAITVLEVTARRVQSIDDGRMQAERVERSMRSIAMRLSATALAMSAARVVASVAPVGRWVAITAAGAFVGGFVGSILWQVFHAGQALASP